MPLSALLAVLFAASPSQNALAAQLGDCKPTREKPTGAAFQCKEGSAAAKFDTKNPETLRSNLCLAQKSNAAVGVDFSLFGHNDGRAARHERELKKITHVVVHNGGYTAQGNADTWECRPAASHYTIDRSGKIFQHAGEERIVGHAGGQHSTMPKLNNESIGVELNIGKHKGTSCNSLKVKHDERGAAAVREACTPTAAQYASLKKLIKAIAARTSVKIDEDHVLGHCESVNPSGHGDPKAFDWAQIGLSNDKKLAQVRAKKTACDWHHLYSSPVAQAKAN